MLVEEYIASPVPASSRRQHLYPLSAKSESALARRMTDLAAHLDENPELGAADVAHTLQRGREAIGERRQKASLPTYPFERRRYWLEMGETETKAKDALHLYEPGWRLAELDHDEAEDDGRSRRRHLPSYRGSAGYLPPARRRR